jgi:deazaflavin-dependent oxidoreductase (nitroreductase family)
MAIRVTPTGSRGARVPTGGLVDIVFKPMGDFMLWLHRRSGGTWLSRMMGFPVVLLTTLGARTGRRRSVAVAGFPHGKDAWLVVASLAGAARHPAWFINMAKHPDGIWLEVGREQFKVRGQSLEGQERAEALARIAAASPRYGRYQEKTDREIPIVRLRRES